MDVKYVIYRRYGHLCPVIAFQDLVQHDEMCPKYPPVSAGFATLDEGRVMRCYGDSQSLGRSSRPEDVAVLQGMLDGSHPLPMAGSLVS